ncbi:hypothetical protein J2Z47_004335 [Cohnella thailandensis]|nr:hypothetical protein [Cohnella thailandensis]
MDLKNAAYYSFQGKVGCIGIFYITLGGQSLSPYVQEKELNTLTHPAR